MSFEKITEEDRANKGNTGLPDTPALTTTEMQERMDSLPNLAIDKFNELVDALNSGKAAGNLGAIVPEGINAQPNIQSIINAMVLNLTLNTSARHTHANKAVLDIITQEALDAYTRTAAMLSAILRIDSTVSNSSTALPTSAAVSTFVESYDIANKVRDVAYPVGAIYSTKNTNPQALLGGTWDLLDTDASGVKRYERTA